MTKLDGSTYFLCACVLIRNKSERALLVSDTGRNKSYICEHSLFFVKLAQLRRMHMLRFMLQRHQYRARFPYINIPLGRILMSGSTRMTRTHIYASNFPFLSVLHQSNLSTKNVRIPRRYIMILRIRCKEKPIPALQSETTVVRNLKSEMLPLITFSSVPRPRDCWIDAQCSQSPIILYRAIIFRFMLCDVRNNELIPSEDILEELHFR